MNFLLSMPNDGQSNNYIINALHDLGHNVFFVDHRARYEECLEHVPNFLMHEKIDIMLVLFFANGRTYDKEYLNMLKARFPQVAYVSWIFDATIDGEYCDENKRFVNLMKSYDFFFTVARGQVESFREQGVKAYHAPEGACPYTISMKGMEQIYDVSFIGQVGQSNVHAERMPLLKAVGNRYDKLKIFGPLFTQDPEIMKYHSRRPTFNDVEHSRVVAQSKINIAHSTYDERGICSS